MGTWERTNEANSSPNSLQPVKKRNCSSLKIRVAKPLLREYLWLFSETHGHIYELEGGAVLSG